jgi:glycosyltransferase involved in cell wall biosynthesis
MINLDCNFLFLNAHNQPSLSINVSFFYRKYRSGAYSIESLFDNITIELNKSGTFISQKVEVPSMRSVLKNCLFALHHQSQINHITGDIHYVALGLPRKTTVLTIHDCVFLTRFSKWTIKYWLFKWLWYKWPIQSAAVVTVISEKTKREVLSLTDADPSKIRIIPNCYDPRFLFSPKEFNAKCPRILQIGTKSNKNIARLAPALKGIPCELHIIGEVEQKDEALLKVNKINYIVHTALKFEDLREQYELCDMVVFASTYEGFGLPILEASAVGRPLVTSCISPMNEIAGDAACKVNPYNIFDIRRGILRVIEDANYRENLVSLSERIREEYSIDRILTRYVEIYKELQIA